MIEIRNARHEDLTAVVEVMNAYDVATLGEPDSSEEDVGSGWEDSGFDVERDAFVAQADGRIVGYGEVYDRGEEGRLDIDVFCRPEIEAEVAPRILDAAVARAQERGGAHVGLATWVPEGAPIADVFGAAGFIPTRSFQRMRARLDDVAPPGDPVPGIDVRPVRPRQDEAVVHDVLADAFAQHVRPMTTSFERFCEQQVSHPDYDADLWAVAWDGDRAVGAITVFDHGDVAFIRHVGVRTDARRRGIASVLIRRAAALLRQRGRQHVDLGVDIDDEVGAARLYASLGFQTVQRLLLVERTAG